MFESSAAGVVPGKIAPTREIPFSPALSVIVIPARSSADVTTCSSNVIVNVPVLEVPPRSKTGARDCQGGGSIISSYS